MTHRASPLRVLVLADKLGATQFISFEQALAAAVDDGAVMLTMASDDKAWDADEARQAYWDEMQPDVLVMSRYSEPRAMAFATLARQHDVPVVFHIDDDLLDVPLALGASKYDFYHQPERLAALRAALDASDRVYASTPALAARLREHGIGAPVVHGNLYCSVDIGRLVDPIAATAPVVGYMGTGGHSQDLALVIPALIRLMNDIPALRFETFGTIKPPQEMAAFGDRYLHHDGVADYEGFIDKLGELGWWVGLAPLEDNPFNRCKADTKWVEYSFAGIATAASDLSVYWGACADGAGELAGSDDTWYRSIDRLLRDAGRREQAIERARRRLRDNYARPRLQDQVLALLHGLRAR